MSVQPRPRAFIQFAGGKTKFKILTVVTVLLAVVTFTVLLLQQITETGNGVYIFLNKTTDPLEKQYYELHDPLDPWTETAFQNLDGVNDVLGFDTYVMVDNLYLHDCALYKHQGAIFKYNDEYYTVVFGYYDSFRFTVHSASLIIVLAWLALGLLWLGSGINVLLKLIRKNSKERVRVQ